MDGECSAIGKGIQDTPTGAVTAQQCAIFALIQEKSCFLTRFNVYIELEAVFAEDQRAASDTIILQEELSEDFEHGLAFQRKRQRSQRWKEEKHSNDQSRDRPVWG